MGEMQPAITKLVALGKLPPSDRTTVEEVAAFQELIEAIAKPVRPEEARALAGVFGDDGDDSCYGLAWALISLIETCGENVADMEGVARTPWVQYMDERWQRGRS